MGLREAGVADDGVRVVIAPVYWCQSLPWCTPRGRTLGSVSGVTLVFRRDLDFSPAIVWDALVDPVLLEGWLADATVDFRLGGRFRLDWIEPAHLVPFESRIAGLEPRVLLELASRGGGGLRFDLEEVAGGSRGTSTALTVTVAGALEPRFAPGVTAHWQSNLDQLAELLRGHPVDWPHWERDRGEHFGGHLEKAQRDSSL